MIEVLTTPKYRKAYKKLESNCPKVVEKLDSIIKDLIYFKITKQYDNHPLKGNKKGYWDLHVAGDVILIYRYIGDSLELDLELTDLTDHDFGLSKKRKLNSSLEYNEFDSLNEDDEKFFNNFIR